MKQSGHLIPSEETGTGCPSLQSMEEHLQTSMKVWVDNNNYGGNVLQYGSCYDLYVSFCFPHLVDVSALSISIVLRAFVVVLSMCLLYVSLWSRVINSILSLMFMESVVLFICSASCALYSAGSGV